MMLEDGSCRSGSGGGAAQGGGGASVPDTAAAAGAAADDAMEAGVQQHGGWAAASAAAGELPPAALRSSDGRRPGREGANGAATVTCGPSAAMSAAEFLSLSAYVPQVGHTFLYS